MPLETKAERRAARGRRRPPTVPLIAPGHRFDQSNGMIVEREPTAAELSNARWSDHEPTSTVFRWGWRVVDPSRPRPDRSPGSHREKAVVA